MSNLQSLQILSSNSRGSIPIRSWQRNDRLYLGMFERIYSSVYISFLKSEYVLSFGFDGSLLDHSLYIISASLISRIPFLNLRVWAARLKFSYFGTIVFSLNNTYLGA